MGRNNYEKEILDYSLDRILRTDAIPAECDCCKEVSVFVELHDTTYRNLGAEKEHNVPLCIYCYYYMIVQPMDDLWAEYHSSIL